MVLDYSPVIWEHFRRPRRVGGLAFAGAGGSGEAGSAAERALLRIQLAVAGGRVVDAAFKAYGCGATIACGSWAADWAVGKTPDQAAGLSSGEIAAVLALPALKIRSAVLAEQALAAAVQDYRTHYEV